LLIHGDLHGGNILIDPQTGAVTAILDWETAGFAPIWAENLASNWLNEDPERFLYGCDDPGNFEEDTKSEASLRALFRKLLQKADPDLFVCFRGGVEFRCLLSAAADRSITDGGQTYTWLSNYYDKNYWVDQRRGPFPFDFEAWALDYWDMGALSKAIQRARAAL
jgi:hypothetical protein